MEIHNSHDRFFKDIFSRTEVPQDFCRRYLPSGIVELLDLSTLTPAKDSFVDQELREYFSDLHFLVKLTTGREIYIYILFEHKSYLAERILFQILCYMVKIWEQDYRQEQSNTHHPSGDLSWQGTMEHSTGLSVVISLDRRSGALSAAV